MLARALVLTTLLLAGCASPGPVVETRGSAIPTTGVFRISSLRPDAPPRAEQLVAEGLRAKGLRAAAGAEPADYSVQVTFADRAPEVGAFLPAASGEPTWRVSALKRKPLSFRNPKGAYTLGVHIEDTVSGRETYDVRVSQTWRKPSPEADLAALVTAAFQPLPTPEP